MAAKRMKTNEDGLRADCETLAAAVSRRLESGDELLARFRGLYARWVSEPSEWGGLTLGQRAESLARKEAIVAEMEVLAPQIREWCGSQS